MHLAVRLILLIGCSIAVPVVQNNGGEEEEEFVQVEGRSEETVYKSVPVVQNNHMAELSSMSFHPYESEINDGEEEEEVVQDEGKSKEEIKLILIILAVILIPPLIFIGCVCSDPTFKKFWVIYFGNQEAREEVLNNMKKSQRKKRKELKKELDRLREIDNDPASDCDSLPPGSIRVITVLS